MRMLAFLLSLFLTWPAGGVRASLTAEKTGLLSAEALAGLNSLLSDTAVILSPAGCDVLWREEELAGARPGAIYCREAAAAVDMPGTADLSALWALLEPWKAEKQETVDLQEAGSARSQCIYVLQSEDWLAIRAGLAQCLALPELADTEVPGKATVKQYFDREGRELGAYFYTSELRLGEDAREVRLEYGFRAEKGLYLAFRCPDAGEKNNLRISLHARKTGAGWTLTGELRETAQGQTATWSVKGKTDGKLTLSREAREGRKTVRRALTLQMGAEAAEYSLTRDGTLLISGRASWQAAELPARELPDTLGTMADVTEALAARLADVLRASAPESWQQLMHYLAAGALLDAQQKGE